MLHHFWPSLLINIPDFIQSISTPIVKAYKKADVKKLNPKIFYTISEYEKWVDHDLKGDTKNWTIKYYKGLGTSTKTEFREYFEEKKNEYIDNLKKLDLNSLFKGASPGKGVGGREFNAAANKSGVSRKEDFSVGFSKALGMIVNDPANSAAYIDETGMIDAASFNGSINDGDTTDFYLAVEGQGN